MKALVVDKTAATRDAIADLIGDLSQGGNVDLAWSTREQAAEKLRAAIAAGHAFDALLLEGDPAPTAQLVRELITAGGGVRIVLLAHGAEGIALATRIGASDVVVRPFGAAELAFRLARVVPDARADKRRPRKSDVLIGAGPWLKDLYDRITMVAVTEATVAIFGESGTGKELVARTIHNSSPRHDAPFVVVNCAAIPEALIEDELFGHVRGAFTDATRDRERGLLAAAHTGTLFLDEIGELPLSLQAKLLRVLQSQEFRRIGDDTDRRVDARIVTATNRDLDQLVARGTFRQDLYYRINVFPLHLPPLRERLDDIALLVHHFVQKYRARLGKVVEGVTAGALARLAAYDFPGNVRELENKIHQAMVIAAGPMIGEDDLTLPTNSIASLRVDVTRPFREVKQETIDAFERAYLTELLRTHHGNLAQAARAAGMDRKNLWALVERHGLDRARFKKP